MTIFNDFSLAADRKNGIFFVITTTLAFRVALSRSLSEVMTVVVVVGNGKVNYYCCGDGRRECVTF